jgi:hypothetical protein
MFIKGLVLMATRPSLLAMYIIWKTEPDLN